MKLTTWALGFAALAVACSSDDGVLVQDAGTQADDATKPDPNKDAGKGDAKAEASVDAASAQDATTDTTVDASTLDAPIDAPTDTLSSACSTNSECATGEFCDHGDNAGYSPNGQCTLPGTCTMIPTCNPNCITNFDTFCGCDGVTYYCPGCAEASGTNVAWVNNQGLNPCP